MREAGGKCPGGMREREHCNSARWASDSNNPFPAYPLNTRLTWEVNVWVPTMGEVDAKISTWGRWG